MALIETASESHSIQNVSMQEISTCQTAKDFASEYLRSQNLTEKEKIRWIKGIYEVSSNVQFYEAKKEEVISLPSPGTIFSKYFTDALLDTCVEKTNLYAVRTSVPNFPATNISEVKAFFGILMVMGNLSYPRVRMYWEPKFAIPLISENMQVNRFFKLRNTMHFTSDEEQNLEDRLWKIRPLYSGIRERCRQLQAEEIYSIDEQMVPFKGAVNIKQYIKNKPTKWGIKLFLLCGVSGTIYDFVIYQGANTELKTEYLLFGQCPAVVMHLSEKVPPRAQVFF